MSGADHERPLLELERVSVALDGNPVVRQLSFRLQRGRIGCLLGPSGCGKTTLLRAIAGFEAVSEGRLWLDGRCVSEAGKTVAPERRRIGMVFQDFALFPHLSIGANIGFGIRRWSRKERNQRVAKLLDLVGLSGYQRRYVHQISGGQQQRVALARALAPQPRLLLLDEPFSSIDSELREALAYDIRDILHQEQVSAILVTHDQHEAFAMSDEIGLIDQGKLVQWGSGYDLYHRPETRFVADFIGQGALIRGLVGHDGQIASVLGSSASPPGRQCPAGSEVEVLVRPDAIQLHPDGPTAATVVERAFRGAEYLYRLELDDGTRVLSLVPSHHRHAIGERVRLRLEVDQLPCFPIG